MDHEDLQRSLIVTLLHLSTVETWDPTAWRPDIIRRGICTKQRRQILTTYAHWTWREFATCVAAAKKFLIISFTVKPLKIMFWFKFYRKIKKFQYLVFIFSSQALKFSTPSKFILYSSFTIFWQKSKKFKILKIYFSILESKVEVCWD